MLFHDTPYKGQQFTSETGSRNRTGSPGW